MPKIYNPILDIASAINNVTTVSGEYIGSYNAYEWKTLFSAIDVADDVKIMQNYKIHNSESDFSESYFSEAVNFGKEGHRYPHLVHARMPPDYPAYITYITFLVKTSQYSFSQIFWERMVDKYVVSVLPNTNVQNFYGPSREAKVFKLNSDQLKSIDLMNWGYYVTNRVPIPSFIFWVLKNTNCIPTNKRKCLLPSNVFTNTSKLLELGGNYIPIIQVSKELSKEWAQLIGLKTKITLTEILSLLAAINLDVTEAGGIKRENIKRIGLLFNELANEVNDFSVQQENEIKIWSRKGKFVCTDLMPRDLSEIIWLRIDGFNEYEDKIPSILVPKNVEVDARIKKLFSLFNIPIVDKCDYKTAGEKEDLHLTIKILEFLPALSLLLASKLKIKNEAEYLTTVLKKIDKFRFNQCSEIQLLLNYGEIEIRGVFVKYYLSEDGLYFTNNWRNPIERFHISHYLATFLNCQGLEREIQLFLELTSPQLIEHLDSLGLSEDTLKDISAYQAVHDKLELLKESIVVKSHRASSAIAANMVSEDAEEYVSQTKNQTIPDKENVERERSFIEEVENFIAELESSEWAQYIPELRNYLELSKSQSKEKQKLFNLIAKLKLAKATSILFDKAEVDFNQLIGNNEKYFVHSARGSFAYIHTNELLRMKSEGFKMALDFGTKSPIKIYETAEEILSLNVNHLLAYQYKKSMAELFLFCQNNREANKHLLVVDRDSATEKSDEIFKLLNPDDDY